MKIAYIVNTYPQPSHSFIRRELTALERLGVEVERIAMRRSDQPLKDPADHEEQALTRYVLDAGGAGLALAVLRVLAARPGRFSAAFRAALSLGRASGTRLR